MAKKEKIPKTYKVKSKTITKKINEAVHNLAKFQGMSQSEKNQILSAIKGTPDYQRLYASLNPSDKQYIDLNIGNPEPGEAGVLRPKKPHFEKIANLTPEQSKGAYAFLEQTIPEAFLPENATPEQVQAAKMQGLPGVLSELGKPYESPLNTQMNQMFGHMANPVLQNFLNPQQGNQPQVLFPSQLPQHYAEQNQQINPSIQNLLGQLGGQAGQYALQNAPGAFNYAQQNAPAAYEALRGLGQQGYQAAAPYAQNAYQGAQNLYGQGREAFGNIAGGFEGMGPILAGGAGLGALLALGRNAYDRFNQ